MACKQDDPTEFGEEYGIIFYELELKYQDIQAVANSKPCIDSTDWKFTSIGTRACGGPQGYIAYSSEIDEPNFLQKVREYSDLEDEYNRKSGISSTCDLPAEPTGVRCENLKPVFIY